MKYFIYNDLEYLITKNKKILLLIFLLPIGSLLLNIKAHVTSIDIFLLSMGLDLDFNSLKLLEIIMYLFNIITFLYLIIKVYIKDILYFLDEIFLRISLGKWYKKKTLLFLLNIFLVKAIQYLILFMIMIIIRGNINILEYIKIFVVDYIYIIFIQYIFLLVYVLNVVFKKYRFLWYLLFLIFVVIFPKSIIGIYKYIIVILVLFTLLQLLLGLLFKHKSKIIMENV